MKVRRCELTLWPMQEAGSSTDFAHKIDSELFAWKRGCNCFFKMFFYIKIYKNNIFYFLKNYF